MYQRLKKSTIWAFLSILIYKIVLDLSYFLIISKVWAYAKLELNFNSTKFIESYFLLFIVFILMPKSKKKLSTILIWLLVMVSYIPMLTLFALKDESRIYIYAVTGFWILIFLLSQIPLISVSFLSRKQSKIIFYFIFIFLVTIDIFLIYKYLGFSFNFNFIKVYDIRLRYVEMAIPLAGYFFNWVAYIVNPIFFVIFLAKRKWFLVALIVSLQLLLFSYTGMKSFIFILAFILVLIWIITCKNPLAYIGIGLSGIILLGLLSYWLIDDIWIASLFTNRVLFVPAQLSFFYYDFFSTHEYTFLSQHRIFRIFLNYPYHLNPPHLIGEVYFNRPQMGANNGIVADAYMNFGFVGFGLWSILLVIILKLFDAFSKNKNIKITVATIAMPAMFLSNSAFLTCLLTHGLLLTLVLLYLLPKNQQQSK